MNILKLPKHKSAISEAAYIALNVGLAVVLLVVVLAVNSPLPAFATRWLPAIAFMAMVFLLTGVFRMLRLFAKR